MVRKIKFNLMCDGQPVRTLEELADNFTLEVMEYYKSGKLQRWLRNREYTKELEQVEAIQETGNFEILKCLATVFGIDCDEDELQMLLDDYEYELNRQKEQIDEAVNESIPEEEIAVENEAPINVKSENNIHEGVFTTSKMSERNILTEKVALKKLREMSRKKLRDVSHGYQCSVDVIIKNKNNMKNIRKALLEISKDYILEYVESYQELFCYFYEEAPLAIFAMLADSNMRMYLLPSNVKTNFAKEYELILINTLLMELVNPISNLKKRIGINLKTFSITPQEYRSQYDSSISWKCVETEGKRCMVIQMDEGTIICPHKKNGFWERKGSSEVNGRFIIFDGIDCFSKVVNNCLWYILV